MLSIKRRNFLSFVFDEVSAFVQESRGTPNFKLTDLPGMAGDDLGRLIPEIINSSRVCRDGGNFVLTDPNGDPEVLFPIGSPAADVWSMIDGRKTILQIAGVLATQWNEDGEAGFAKTRKVFLNLVGRQICAPRNSVQT